MHRRVFFAGDNIPFAVVVRDAKGNAVNITGWTIKWRFKMGTAAAQEKTATITDGPNGKALYRTLTSELVEGDLQWMWVTLDASGNKVSSGGEEFIFRARVNAVLA